MRAATILLGIITLGFFVTCSKSELGVPGSDVPAGNAPGGTEGETPIVKEGAAKEIVTKEKGKEPDAMNLNAIAAGFVLPRIVTLGVQSSRSMIVEAVYYATMQTGSGQFGQITSTGTIQVTQFGAQYTPSPADKLIVKLGDQTHEFKLINAQGNPAAESAAAWLTSPHQLEYLHSFAGAGEVTVKAQFDGQTFTAIVGGFATFMGQRYDLNLSATGGTQGSRDFNGQETKTQYRLTGTIKGGGNEIDVLEDHVSTFVSSISLQLLPSQRGSASQIFCTLNSTVRAKGETFTFSQVNVEANTRDKGGNVSGGITSASGAILRNGSLWGQCAAQGNGLVVNTASGAIPIRLE
ncbi:MAG: hypothetical protein ACKVS6_03945 [Planctomycetota bacterium]